MKSEVLVIPNNETCTVWQLYGNRGIKNRGHLLKIIKTGPADPPHCLQHLAYLVKYHIVSVPPGFSLKSNIKGCRPLEIVSWYHVNWRGQMARTGLNPKGLIWGCPLPNHPFACWQAPSQNWPSAYGLEERVSDPLTHYSVFDVCCQLIRFPFLQKTVHFGALTRISTKALSSIGLSFRNLSDLWSS